MICETTDELTAPPSSSELDEVMVTLGEIARVVFPNGDLPAAIQVQLFRRPAFGLGMLTSCASYRNADRRVLGPLFGKLPENFQTMRGVSAEGQRHFWLAYLSMHGDTE